MGDMINTSMIYQEDYFGFVYKWWDMKRNMYYIGSHHGSTEDGYICSNARMQAAYAKRPDDFMRMILEHNTVNDTKTTLQLEQIQLDIAGNVAEDEQYYNKKNEALGGWSHITNEIKQKRIQSLIDRQARDGLTNKERQSYPKKIAARLKRIKEIGFTKLEQEQHNSYGCRCLMVGPDGTQTEYPSMSEGKRQTGIDCMYGSIVTSQGRTYKGYKIYRISEPKVDCRTFKE